MVSGADEIRLRSYINHTIYARLHDLDYRLECGLAEGVENKFFYKTATVLRLLPLYDWIVWLDDDVYVTDFARDNFRTFVLQAENEGKFMVIADGPLEPNGFWSTINTGVFGLRNCPEAFEMLSMMDARHLAAAEEWWDPSRHGVFTGGDQDLMTWWLDTTERMGRVLFVEHRELNSRGHYYDRAPTDAFAMHFCGYPDKKIGVVAFADRFGLGQELVPEDLLDRFSVRVRDPMNRFERLRRTQAWHWRGRLKPYLKPIITRVRTFRRE